MQMLCQIIAAYFEDDCADELTNDPVLTPTATRKAKVLTFIIRLTVIIHYFAMTELQVIF